MVSNIISEWYRKLGKKGGKAKFKNMSKKERVEFARKGGLGKHKKS